MSNNTKNINEREKFNISYIFAVLREFGAKSKNKELELEREIKAIEEQQDTEYIIKQEEGINSISTRKTTRRRKISKDVESGKTQNIVKGKKQITQEQNDERDDR